MSNRNKALHRRHRQHMRERYLANSGDGFQDHELVELLLFYSVSRINTNPIAHDLLNKYGTLDALMNVKMFDLTHIKGIGVNSAMLLRLLALLPEYVKEQEFCRSAITLHSMEEAGIYLKNQLRNEPPGTYSQLCCTRSGKVTLYCPLKDPAWDIRTMGINAIIGSASFVFVGRKQNVNENEMPLPQDYDSIRKLQEAFRSLDIQLCDYLILCENRSISMAKVGFIQDHLIC